MIVAVALCGAARGDDDPKSTREAVVRELVTAVTKRDVAAIAARVSWPLRVRGLWFDTERCQKFGGTPGPEVGKDQLPELIACLAELGVRPPDAPVRFPHFVYGPGIPVTFSLHAPPASWQLRGLWGSSVPGGGSGVLVEPNAFVTHVAKFSREIVPDRAIKQEIDADPDAIAAAKVFVCVDAKGVIDELLVTDDSRKPNPTYIDLVKQTIRRWKITKPFAAHATAVRACTMMILGYPVSRFGFPLEIPPPPPPPPPSSPQSGPPDRVLPPAPTSGSPGAPSNVAPTLLEGHRIAGEKNIVPDDATKTAIAKAGATRVVASFKLCVDKTGTVSSLAMLKSSGFDAYDQDLQREMSRWRYSPYEVNGQPANVCTAVTFIYRQN